MLKRLPHQWQVLTLALLAGAPGVGAAIYLLWRPLATGWLQAVLLLLILV